MPAKDILELFFTDLPDLQWKSLDAPNEKPDKEGVQYADYRLDHESAGSSISEFKAMNDAQVFQNQQALSDTISKRLSGLVSDISFFCFVNGKNPPTGEDIEYYRPFIRLISSELVKPCSIIFPEDSIFGNKDFVKIERLDDNDAVEEAIYMPPTHSGKYPYPRFSHVKHRFPSKPCRITDKSGERVVKDIEAFASSHKATLQLKSNNGSGGAIVGPSTGGMMFESERIRSLIGKAGKQLRSHKDEGCPLGLIMCHTGLISATFTDLQDAIMGETVVTMNVHVNGRGPATRKEPTLMHGKGRAFQADKNTSISYVGWMDYIDGKVALKVFHNDFSKKKLPYEFLDSSDTRQYIVQYRDDGTSIAGVLVEVDSTQKLEDIRRNNAPLIEVMREAALTRKKESNTELTFRNRTK